jgi:hypothetical protein
MHKPSEIVRPTPPSTYAPVSAPQGYISPLATAVGGLIGGALLGAGWMASRGMKERPEATPHNPPPDQNSGSSGQD